MFLIMLAIVNCLNVSFYNSSSFTGLFTNENNAFQSCQSYHPHNIIGWALFFITFIVMLGAMALRFDIAVSGVVASFIECGFTLFFIQEGWLGTNVIALPVVLTAIFVILVMGRGGSASY